MLFMKTSHDTLKCHICQFLECKVGRLELVFGGSVCQEESFCQLQLFPKVKVHSTKPETKLALEKKVTYECDVFTNTML